MTRAGESVSHDEIVVVVLDLLRAGQQPDGLRRESRSLCRFARRSFSQEMPSHRPGARCRPRPGRHVGDVVPGRVELDDWYPAAELPCHELRGFRCPRQRAVLNRDDRHIRQAPSKQHGPLDTPRGQPAVVARLGVPCEV